MKRFLSQFFATLMIASLVVPPSAMAEIFYRRKNTATRVQIANIIVATGKLDVADPDPTWTLKCDCLADGAAFDKLDLDPGSCTSPTITEVDTNSGVWDILVDAADTNGDVCFIRVTSDDTAVADHLIEIRTGEFYSSLDLTSGTATRPAMNLVGNTSGPGLKSTGGNAAAGIYADGNAAAGIAATGYHGITGTAEDAAGAGIKGAGVGGQGLFLTGGSGNGVGANVLGFGTGNGMTITSGSGATGDALSLVAASTNGNGLKSAGTGSGSGQYLYVPAASSGYALKAEGAAGGIFAYAAGNGSGNGSGIIAQSAATGGTDGLMNGFYVIGAPTNGKGVYIKGGSTSGNGIDVSTTNGIAISAQAAGSGQSGIFASGPYGMTVYTGTTNGTAFIANGAGTNAKAFVAQSNGTAAAATFTAGGTNASAIVLTPSGTGTGINCGSAVCFTSSSMVFSNRKE